MGWEKARAPGPAWWTAARGSGSLEQMGWWAVMVEKDEEAVGAIIRPETGILACVRSRVVRGAGV